MTGELFMETPLTYIMISPHYPKNFQPFVARLKNRGVRVLGIASEPYDLLSQELKDDMTEYYRVDNMSDYEQMYKAVAYFAFKYGRIHRLESHNEHWMESDARLRTDFNIPGLKSEQMDRLKKKSEMKKVFRQCGIPVAKGMVFQEWEQAQAIAAEVGYPVIVKPNIGVGATNTWKISNDDELAEFFVNLSTQETYIMEEFIDGGVVTFDGLTDREGNIVFYQNMIYDRPALEILTQDVDCYLVYPKEIPEDIIKFGTQCVKAFGIKERFFHFEFFRLDADQSLMGLEINCRPPGGPIIEMFNFANSFDVYDLYAQIVMNSEYTIDLSKRTNTGYANRKYQHQYVNSQDEVYARYGEHIVSTVYVEGAFGDVGYFINADSIELMDEIVAYIQALRV